MTRALAWLASVALASGVGCLAIPVPVSHERTASTPMADPASDEHKWVQTVADGQTTRAQIRAKLGPPDQEWDGGRVVGYRARAKDGAVYAGILVFYPPIVGAGKVFDTGTLYLLLLEYAPDGVLKRHELRKLGLDTSDESIDRLARRWAAGGEQVRPPTRGDP